jgi:CarD family transcriptional regulator
VTFQIGDKVIYPNHGLGIVERIEEKTILGTTCGFYHLRIAANDTTVLVPLANVDGVGLRRAIDDGEVDRLFRLLGDGKIDSQQNWKGRFKDNSEKMRTGSIYDVADVLKSLTLLAKSKSLSFREKRMLDRARYLIITEVSEVTREASNSIEGKLDQALDRCLSNRTKAQAKVKVEKAPIAKVTTVAVKVTAVPAKTIASAKVTTVTAKAVTKVVAKTAPATRRSRAS